MVKLKVALYHASAGTEGSRCRAVLMLDLGTSWGLVVTATSRKLYPPEKRPSANSAGGWVGSEASSDGHGEEKIFYPPHPSSNPEPSSL
jgi:hypothetical protein